MGEERKSDDSKSGVTVALVIGAVASLVVTGALVLPVGFALEWLETQKILKLPDFLVTPLAFVVVGLYLFITKVIAGYVDRRFFE